jgi:hypothetical protein
MELMETTQARSLRTLQVKLIKIGAKVVRRSSYVIFQMAEVLVSKGLFQEILERVYRLKPVLIGTVLYFGNLNFDIV